MDFGKLQRDIAALLAPARAPQAKAAETKRMTAKEFAEYADGQVKKAKVEADGGKIELAKRRLTALQTEVTALAKFEFGSKDLPSVTVYKDPDQLDTEEREVQPVTSPQPGATHWQAKSNELAKQLAETIGELSNRPTDKNDDPGKPGEEKPAEETPADKPGEEKPAEETPAEKQAKGIEWPRDLAKSIRPSARDKDADYDWGRDAG